MANLADMIEEFILNRLDQEQDGVVILRRNELAETLACAPSQISYVLSTRFTLNRGFIVESRRGSGGFIRIARLPLQQVFSDETTQQAITDANNEKIFKLVDHLQRQGLLTPREAALMRELFKLVSNRFSPRECGMLLRDLLQSLVNQA